MRKLQLSVFLPIFYTIFCFNCENTVGESLAEGKKHLTAGDAPVDPSVPPPGTPDPATLRKFQIKGLLQDIPKDKQTALFQQLAAIPDSTAQAKFAKDLIESSPNLSPDEKIRLKGFADAIGRDGTPVSGKELVAAAKELAQGSLVTGGGKAGGKAGEDPTKALGGLGELLEKVGKLAEKSKEDDKGGRGALPPGGGEGGGTGGEGNGQQGGQPTGENSQGKQAGGTPQHGSERGKDRERNKPEPEKKNAQANNDSNNEKSKDSNKEKENEKEKGESLVDLGKLKSAAETKAKKKDENKPDLTPPTPPQDPSAPDPFRYTSQGNGPVGESKIGNPVASGSGISSLSNDPSSLPSSGSAFSIPSSSSPSFSSNLGGAPATPNDDAEGAVGRMPIYVGKSEGVFADAGGSAPSTTSDNDSDQTVDGGAEEAKLAATNKNVRPNEIQARMVMFSRKEEDPVASRPGPFAYTAIARKILAKPKRSDLFSNGTAQAAGGGSLLERLRAKEGTL